MLKMKIIKEESVHLEKFLTRRQFLITGMMVSATAMLAACGLLKTGTEETPGASAPAASVPSATPQASVIALTPSCGEAEAATPEVTEGPYFTPNSPEMTSLLQQGMPGTILSITGYVLSTSCQPIAHALLDFWQADDSGEYDNSGFTLRGHQYTNDKGQFTLTTIVPGLYPGRTRHIHVKAQAPNQPVLTTQLFFPNEAGNTGDNIFVETLLMSVRDSGSNAKSGSFNFVLPV